MNDPEQARLEPTPEENQPARGVNLVLIYGLMIVALLAAIGLAALIVLPFYRHR